MVAAALADKPPEEREPIWRDHVVDLKHPGGLPDNEMGKTRSVDIQTNDNMATYEAMYRTSQGNQGGNRNAKQDMILSPRVPSAEPTYRPKASPRTQRHIIRKASQRSAIKRHVQRMRASRPQWQTTYRNTSKHRQHQYPQRLYGSVRGFGKGLLPRPATATGSTRGITPPMMARTKERRAVNRRGMLHIQGTQVTTT